VSMQTRGRFVTRPCPAIQRDLRNFCASNEATHWSHEPDRFHPFAARIRSAKARCVHLDKESGNWKNNQIFSAHALNVP